MRLSSCGVLCLLGASPTWAAEPGAVDDVGTLCVLAAPSSALTPRAAVVPALVTAAAAELRRLYGPRVIATPPLDIDDIQLALGCAGQDPMCLVALARQLRADTLVLVRATGAEAVALERIDGPSGTTHSVVRGAAAEVEALARGLFHGVSAEPRSLALPVVAASAGAATLITAAVFGALARSAEADYAASPITSRGDVDAALDTLSRGEGHATASTVLWIVGGALAAGGGAWLAYAALADAEGS